MLQRYFDYDQSQEIKIKNIIHTLIEDHFSWGQIIYMLECGALFQYYLHAFKRINVRNDKVSDEELWKTAYKIIYLWDGRESKDPEKLQKKAKANWNKVRKKDNYGAKMTATAIKSNLRAMTERFKHKVYREKRGFNDFHAETREAILDEEDEKNMIRIPSDSELSLPEYNPPNLANVEEEHKEPHVEKEMRKQLELDASGYD